MAGQLSPPPAPSSYLDPNDLLVTPPGAGFDGWFTRVVGALRRNWRTLLLIILVTQVLPVLVIDLRSLSLSSPAAAMPDALIGLAVGVVAALLQSTGWAAGTWAVTRQAVGEPGSVGAALRYGLERALGLFGWILLAGLLIAIGLCACILPGVYLAFASSMVAPVFLFERTNPIGRSFRIFHARPGMLLGRLSLVIGSLIVVILAQEATLLALGADAGFSAASVATVVVWDLLSLPVYAALPVGLLITYAEQRGQEAPVNAARLAEELG